MHLLKLTESKDLELRSLQSLSDDDWQQTF